MSEFICPNCGEKSEMSFMLSFARTEDFNFEVVPMQLRSLWTAYCIRHDYDVDTKPYEDDINWIWHALKENQSVTLHDEKIGYAEFYAYMSEEVL